MSRVVAGTAEGGVRPRAVGVVPSGLADASPTCELELLLSGAVLVALFQVSGVLDRAFDRYSPHVTRAAAFPLFAYWYVLTVERAPPAPGSRRPPRPLGPYVIPFWL